MVNVLLLLQGISTLVVLISLGRKDGLDNRETTLYDRYIENPKES